MKGETVSADILQETGMFRKYRGKWQWKGSPDSNWMTSNTKEGAIEEAAKYYFKLPEIERIPKSVRDERYNVAKLGELVSRYSKRSNEFLRVKLQDNVMEAAKLNARYQKLGINQYGTQRTAGIANQLNAISIENSEIRSVLNARQQKEGETE